MLEGRGNTSGWLVVGVAIVALVAFTGLLYVRGGSGPPISLSAGTVAAEATVAPSAAPGASASGLVAAGSGKPAASRAPTSSTASGSAPAASPTAVVAGATSRPTTVPTKTPRPTATGTDTSAPSPTDAGGPYRLPASPQAASVALENGQGGCPKFPSGGVLAETSFSLAAGKLSANSPSNHRLTGKLGVDGSFNLSGANPVERWIGTLTDTGGTGSYFVVTDGCTEGYETTIAFHP